MVLRQRNAFVYARRIVDGTTCYFPSGGVLRLGFEVWNLPARSESEHTVSLCVAATSSQCVRVHHHDALLDRVLRPSREKQLRALFCMENPNALSCVLNCLAPEKNLRHVFAAPSHEHQWPESSRVVAG